MGTAGNLLNSVSDVMYYGTALRNLFQAGEEMDPDTKQAYNALMNMEKREGKIIEGMANGILAQGYNGMVTFRDEDAAEDAELLKLVKQENKSRMVYLSNFILNNDKYTFEDLPTVQKAYAKYQIDNKVPARSWYQDEDGNWKQK